MLKNFPQRVRNILEQIQLYRGKNLKYQHYKDTMAYAKGTNRVKEVSTTSNVTASTYIHKNNNNKQIQGNTASQKENSIDIFQQES